MDRDDMFAHRVVLSLRMKTTKTLAVTSRKGRKVNRRLKEYEDTAAPAARSFYAKDHEHYASGRSPGFWLERFSCRLPIPSRTVAVLIAESAELLTSYSSATASDLHRLPYSAG